LKAIRSNRNEKEYGYALAQIIFLNLRIIDAYPSYSITMNNTDKNSGKKTVPVDDLQNSVAVVYEGRNLATFLNSYLSLYFLI